MLEKKISRWRKQLRDYYIKNEILVNLKTQITRLKKELVTH